jgi:hypothetical protein
MVGRVALLQSGQEQVSIEIDEIGNFHLSNVVPGEYDIVIHFKDVQIVLPSVVV